MSIVIITISIYYLDEQRKRTKQKRKEETSLYYFSVDGDNNEASICDVLLRRSPLRDQIEE